MPIGAPLVLGMDLGWWSWCLGLGKGESTGKAREGVRKEEKTVNNIWEQSPDLKHVM